MKTITIELNNNLEKALLNLPQDGDQDIATVVIKVLTQGLSEEVRRAKTIQALNEVFSKQIPSPFNSLSENVIINIVDEEIKAARQAQ